MKKQTEKPILIVVSALSALFVVVLSLLLYKNALRIRNSVLSHIQTSAETSLTAAEAAGKQTYAFSEDALADYQQAMVSALDQQDSPYPYYSGSFLMDSITHTVLIRSQNALICTLTSDTETKRFPLVFDREYTPEVGTVLQQHSLSWRRGTTSGKLVITCYRDGAQYVIHSLDSGYLYFESTNPIPAGADLITLADTLRGGEYVSMLVEQIPMNFGARDFGSSNYLSGWKACNSFLEKAPEEAAYLVRGAEVTQSSNLFSTTYYMASYISDRQHALVPEGTHSVRYLYCARFSPLGLAAKELLQNGTIPILLLCFLMCGFLLCEFLFRSMEHRLTEYQDEITRQRQALKYAEDAERSRRDMTSAIAHELKTPLAVLSSYTEALQENIDPTKQGHYLSVIREEAEKMDQMVLELLDLSRLEAGRYKLDRQYFDLKDLTEEILQPLMPQIEEKQILIKWNVHTVLFYGDRKRFGQVVENFLTNAIRHTPEGGTIVIRIGGEQTFSVENTGAQLPPDQLTKVWEAFWQGDASRQQKGTGLGLAICKTILELHGGSCKAENTPNGVNFIADLSPAKPDPISRFPKDDVIELEYMIAQEQTTLLSVFTHLSLLSKSRLRQEIRAGAITCPGVKITSPRTKLRAGNRIIWKEYRITITEENLEKRRAILHNRLSANGGLGSTSASDAILGVRR